MIKKYNKLIRDKVLERIRADGEIPYYRRIFKSEEFIDKLKEKISEEANELVAAVCEEKVLDEIADIQELIDTLLGKMRISKSEIWKHQIRKKKERGGFEKGIFLMTTEIKPRA